MSEPRGGITPPRPRPRAARAAAPRSASSFSCSLAWTIGAISFALNEVVSPEITQVDLARRRPPRRTVYSFAALKPEPSKRSTARCGGVELGHLELEAQLLAADRQLLADPRADAAAARARAARRPPARSSTAAPCRPRAATGTPPPAAWRRSRCSRSASAQPPAGFGPRRWRSGTTSAGAGGPSRSSASRALELGDRAPTAS